MESFVCRRDYSFRNHDAIARFYRMPLVDLILSTMEIFPQFDRAVRVVIALTPFFFFISLFPFVVFVLSVALGIIASYAGVIYLFLLAVVLLSSIPVGCLLFIFGIWFMIFKILRKAVNIFQRFSTGCSSFVRSVFDTNPMKTVVFCINEVYRNGVCGALFCLLFQGRSEIQCFSIVSCGFFYVFAPFHIFLSLCRSMFVTMVIVPRPRTVMLLLSCISKQAIHFSFGKIADQFLKRPPVALGAPAIQYKAARRGIHVDATTENAFYVRDQVTGEIYCRIQTAGDEMQVFVHSYGILVPRDTLLLLLRDYFNNVQARTFFREDFEIPVVFIDLATQTVTHHIFVPEINFN